MKQQIYIGVDGGGTKTEMVLVEQDGTVLHRLVLGPCNPNDIGLERACSVLAEGSESLLAERAIAVEDINALFAGVSGAGVGDYRNKLGSFLKAQFPQAAVRCDTDGANALSSGLGMGPGVAVISGTGSALFIRSEGQIYRVGGWGYLFDQAGSGYDLGREAMRAALAAGDGVGPKTKLTELVEQALGTTAWEALGDVYCRGKRYVASLSHCVFDAYEQGDALAQRILLDTAAHLAELIVACERLYCCGRDVVLCGGLFARKQVLCPMLQQELPSGFRLLLPRLPQIYGAAVQAADLCGRAADLDFEEQFAQSYKTRRHENELLCKN